MQSKLFIMLLLLTHSIISTAQSKKEAEDYYSKVQKMYNSNQFTIDNGSIVKNKIFENLEHNKNELFIRTQNFIARYFVDGKTTIQVVDKEKGVIIVKGRTKVLTSKAKGLMSSCPIHFSCDFILRFDIKDNKIRIILSASDMICDDEVSPFTYEIVDYLPFTQKVLVRLSVIKIWAVANAGEQMLRIFDSIIDDIQNVVKNGALCIEDQDW